MPEFKFLDGRLVLRALKPLLAVASVGIINYSPEELSLVVSVSPGLLIAALRITPSDLLFFYCNVERTAGLNLQVFYRLLMMTLVSDEDFLTIYGGEGDYIHCVYRGFEEDSFYNEMIVIPGSSIWEINAFQYEYEVVVGIPSDNFSSIIDRLSGFRGPVYTTITDTEVIFEAEDKVIILSIENNECIIGGVPEDDLFCFVFDLNHANSLSKALLLSSSVWMFQSETFPCLLNFPVGGLGNIMYYFP